MSDDMVRNLKQASAWFRVLFMAGFVIALYVTGVVLLVIMLAQIIFTLLTGADNVNLRRLGAGLSRYVSQILAFLTYNSELKPFPFLPFPLESAVDASADEGISGHSAASRHADTGPTDGSSSGVTPSDASQYDGVQAQVIDDTVTPIETQSASSGSVEQAQAIADDDGFRNPDVDVAATAATDDSSAVVPGDDTASTSGSKKKITDAEAPRTDD